MPDTDPVAATSSFVSALRDGLRKSGGNADDAGEVTRFAAFHLGRNGGAPSPSELDEINREALAQTGRDPRQGALSSAAEAFGRGAFVEPVEALTGDMQLAEWNQRRSAEMAQQHPVAAQVGSMAGRMTAPIIGGLAGSTLGPGGTVAGVIAGGIANLPGAGGRGMERSIELGRRKDMTEGQKMANQIGSSALDVTMGFLPGGVLMKNAGGATVGKIVIGSAAEGAAIGAGTDMAQQGLNLATGAQQGFSLSEVGASALGGAIPAGLGAGIHQAVTAPARARAYQVEQEAQGRMAEEARQDQQMAEVTRDREVPMMMSKIQQEQEANPILTPEQEAQRVPQVEGLPPAYEGQPYGPAINLADPAMAATFNARLPQRPDLPESGLRPPLRLPDVDEHGVPYRVPAHEPAIPPLPEPPRAGAPAPVIQPRRAEAKLPPLPTARSAAEPASTRTPAPEVQTVKAEPTSARATALHEKIKSGHVEAFVAEGEDGKMVQYTHPSVDSTGHIEGMRADNPDEVGRFHPDEVKGFVTPDKVIHAAKDDGFAPLSAGPRETKTVVTSEPAVSEKQTASRVWPSEDPRPHRVFAADRPPGGKLTKIEELGRHNIGVEHEPGKGYRAVTTGLTSWSKGSRNLNWVPINKDLTTGQGATKILGANKAEPGVWHPTKEAALQHAADYQAGRRGAEVEQVQVPKPAAEPDTNRAAEVESAAMSAAGPRAGKVEREKLLEVANEAGHAEEAKALAETHQEIEEGVKQLESDRASGAGDAHLGRLREAVQASRQDFATAAKSLAEKMKTTRMSGGGNNSRRGAVALGPAKKTEEPAKGLAEIRAKAPEYKAVEETLKASPMLANLNGGAREYAATSGQTLHVAGEDTTGRLMKVVQRAGLASQIGTALIRDNAADFRTFETANRKTGGRLGHAMLDVRAEAARAGKTLSTAEALEKLEAKGFSEDQLEAAQAAYSTYQRINAQAAEAFAAAAKATIGNESRDYANAAKAMRDRAAEAYVPLRRKGQYIVRTKAETRGYDTAFQALAARDAARKAGDATAVVDPTPEYGKSASSALGEVGTFERILAESGFVPEHISEIMDAVRPVLLDKTAAANELRAAGKPGYDSNLTDVMAETLPRRAIGIGRLAAAHNPRFLGLDAEILAKNNDMNPRHVTWFRKYQADKGKDYTATDKILSWWGAGTALTGLSSPITGLTNLVSQLQSAQVAAFISGKRNPLTGAVKGVFDIARAAGKLPMELAASAKGMKGGIEAADTRFDAAARTVEALKAKGDTELASELESWAASAMARDSDAYTIDMRDAGRSMGQNLSRALLWTQAHTSRIARVQTWLTGASIYREMDAGGWARAKQLGYQGDKELGQFADWYVGRIEGAYGKEHRPEWARSGLPAVAYTFQSYAHNQAHLLWKLAKAAGTGEAKSRAFAALVSHLGALTLMGGALNALPFARTLTDLTDKIRGDGDKLADDIGRELGTWTTESSLAELLPDGVAHDVLKAIGERSGIGSAASGVPGVEIPLQLWQGGSDLAGGARDVLKGGADYYAGRDRFSKGLQAALPQAKRYVKAATGESLTSANGKVQVADPTAEERLTLALGATPARQVAARKAGAIDTTYHAGRVRSLAAEIADAVVDGEPERRDRVRQDFLELRRRAVAEYQAEKDPQRKAILRGRLAELDVSKFNARVRQAVVARRNPEAAAIKSAPVGYRQAVRGSFATGTRENQAK